MRHNPKGIHFERWRCDRGCGKWFNAVRDTVSLDFKAYYPATALPPLDWMKKATGEWAQFFAPKIAALEAQAAAPAAANEPLPRRSPREPASGPKTDDRKTLPPRRPARPSDRPQPARFASPSTASA